MKLMAVKHSDKNLKYIKDPTEEMKLTPVKHSNENLKYIKDQTITICIQAIKNDIYANKNYTKIIVDVLDDLSNSL
jgi:hypothetical protein